MNKSVLDAATFQKMFLTGAARLEAKKEWINELNVFPVPDGDTGTNMTLTILSAVKEVQALEEVTMESLSKVISSGTLRGARGNSGVILSQLCRGFTKELKNHKEADKVVICSACSRAVETAYKAVMKPKEGTILTVAKGIADKACELAKEEISIEVMVEEIIKHGDYVLSKTPDMLPVLKQAGVVDSGGQGLMEVLKGAYDSLVGNSVDYEILAPTEDGPATIQMTSENIDTSDIKFGYCTEFIVMLDKEFNHHDEKEVKSYLDSIGDSIVVVTDDEIVKIHVHTNDPGLAIQKALTYGSLSKIKIDNMREEHQEKLIFEAEKKAAAENVSDESDEEKSSERKLNGFISVSIGEGLKEIFKSLGVDYIIEGGQTMNPSTEDMLNAIDKVNADTIYILPNNSNIILAAEQAKHLVEDKNIVVIPSKNAPQGIAAIIDFVEGKTPEENLERMTEGMKVVRAGSVTYAVRDTVIDEKEIKEHDIMGIADTGIVAVSQDIKETTLEMIDVLMFEDAEIISIYYGEETSEEDAEKIVSEIEEKYPDVDVDLNYGGQPIYYYIVSVE